MDTSFAIRLDDAGTIAHTEAELGSLPAKIDRARRRALRKLATWVERQVLRAVAEMVGTTQKTIKALSRFHSKLLADGGISIWVGTNPIDVHLLGLVTWKRGSDGARVGRRVYPGTWAWGEQGRTPFSRTRVLQRMGGARLPIQVVQEWVDDTVRRRIEEMTADIGERFERLMAQELRYALDVEGRAAA